MLRPPPPDSPDDHDEPVVPAHAGAGRPAAAVAAVADRLRLRPAFRDAEDFPEGAAPAPLTHPTTTTEPWSPLTPVQVVRPRPLPLWPIDSDSLYRVKLQ